MDNTGTESLLLTLKGTVPNDHNGVRYHTPMEIYLPPEYPNKAPMAFVRPSPNMFVKPEHPNVTPNGECRHAYLRTWQPAHCSLGGLIAELFRDFSAVSPLFTVCPPQPIFFLLYFSLSLTLTFTRVSRTATREPRAIARRSRAHSRSSRRAPRRSQSRSR